MGLSNPLRHFAFAQLKAFPVIGRGGAELWRDLLASAQVDLSRGPHDADVLVLAGEIPPDWGQMLRALFETFALPRSTLWLPPAWDCELPTQLPMTQVAPRGKVNWQAVTEQLLNLDSIANQQLLPDQPPMPWRGQGDHGQGGKGMMGGRPYGRSMAMTMEDSDNLALDDVPTVLGPYFVGLPSGLRLDLKVQGDRIRVCQQVTNTFPAYHLSPAVIRHGEPVLQALANTATPVAELERTRLRSHLGWLADVLELTGREALAHDMRGVRHGADARGVERLLRQIDSWTLRRLFQGIGVIDKDQADSLGLTGPVARASGIDADERSADPAYRGLNFAAQIESGGDVWARLQVRVRECRQSLRLIAQAGDVVSLAREGARGRFGRDRAGGIVTPSAVNMAALKPNLAGLEWFEAVLFIASLDLDMAEAALV